MLMYFSKQNIHLTTVLGLSNGEFVCIYSLLVSNFPVRFIFFAFRIVFSVFF